MFQSSHHKNSQILFQPMKELKILERKKKGYFRGKKGFRENNVKYTAEKYSNKKKNSLDGLSNRVQVTENIISHKNRLIEVMKSEKQIKNRLRVRLRDQWKYNKIPYICIISVPRRGGKRKWD